MRWIAGAASLLVVACQQQPPNDGGNQQAPVHPPQVARNEISHLSPEPSNDMAGGSSADAEIGQSRARNPLGSLPPADTPLRFVGRWAAKADFCADKAWRFTATSLSTPAGSQCRFTHVEKAPGGYDIDARCTAEGPETSDRITLRFAESARAMLFESGVIADAGLIYCGK